MEIIEKAFIKSKPATIKLINKKNGCYKVEVTKKKIRGMKANDCWFNASKVSDKDYKRYKVQSGWLVGDDFGIHGSPLIPHYWIFDTQKNSYFDPTPSRDEDNQTYDYVCDSDIFFTVGEFLIKTHTLVLPPPLILMNDGEFYVCTWNEDQPLSAGYKSIKTKVKNLDIKSLMRINGVNI